MVERSLLVGVFGRVKLAVISDGGVDVLLQDWRVSDETTTFPKWLWVVLIGVTDANVDEDCVSMEREVWECSLTATAVGTDSEVFNSTGITLSVTFWITATSEVTDMLEDELDEVLKLELLGLESIGVVVELKCVDVDDEFNEEMERLLSCRWLRPTDRSV
jgi:hypothetical protein